MPFKWSFAQKGNKRPFSADFFFPSPGLDGRDKATNVSGISIFCPRLSLLARLMSELEGFGTSWRLWIVVVSKPDAVCGIYLFPLIVLAFLR